MSRESNKMSKKAIVSFGFGFHFYENLVDEDAIYEIIVYVFRYHIFSELTIADYDGFAHIIDFKKSEDALRFLNLLSYRLGKRFSQFVDTEYSFLDGLIRYDHDVKPFPEFDPDSFFVISLSTHSIFINADKIDTRTRAYVADVLSKFMRFRVSERHDKRWVHFEKAEYLQLCIKNLADIFEKDHRKNIFTVAVTNPYIQS